MSLFLSQKHPTIASKLPPINTAHIECLLLFVIPMSLTNELFLDYLECKYKAFCKYQGKVEIKSDYELLQAELESEYQVNAIAYLKSCKEVVKDYSFQDDKVHWNFFVLKKQNDTVPLHFCKNKKLSKNDTLYLAASCFLFGKKQNKTSEYGKIVLGEKFKTIKVNIHSYIQQVEEIFQAIQTFVGEEPIFVVGDYCRMCSFCKTWAKEKDDLSLLRGMSNKDIIKQHKKGIFTVTQFSYTFRPKKQRKRVKHFKNAYLFELKALAIREKKIHIVEKPNLPVSNIAIYFDIEGNSESTFYYLIGLVIVENGTEKNYSFWADTKDEEEIILQKFIAICNLYKDVTLFHYGSYEITFLKKMKKQFNGKYEEQINRLLEKTVNILTIIYDHIYFPTYSNELKDIGRYLGLHWTEKNASGIQSLVWRKRWEITKDTLWKEKLLHYNLEDCWALQKVTQCMYKISANTAFTTHYENDQIVWTKDIKENTNYRLGKAHFFFPEFDYINKSAYFDYQREKIFLRTSNNTKKHTLKKGERIKKEKVNKYIIIKSSPLCPFCKSKKLYRRETQSKVVYDLKFSPGGVKKWIVKYTAVSMRCGSCNKEFLPKKYKQIQQRYGHNVISWVLYQIIVNGISLERIKRNLSDFFGLSFASSTLYSFKTYAATYYQFTYKKIYKNLMHGTLIHADETKVNLKKEAGYVWVFTNVEEVIFLYRDSREGIFLKEFLENFSGVLITDYYAAYDFLDFPQQKCLIHLIRDLNHDLFQNPFDQELKVLVQQFAMLLKTIISTIDTYGLKKRYLHKHKKDTEKFFTAIMAGQYRSEVAESYQKRFEKNKDTLFTFLDYDGIPWNNNNAEHALKHFTTYRKTGDGIFTQSGIEDYLVLLSIYQTCRYKNINFLQFLLSKKKIIDTFQ